MKVDEVLERINSGRKTRGEKEIKFDTLTTEEMAEVFKISQESEAKELNIEAVKDHIRAMKSIVEKELTKEKMERFSLWSFLFGWKQDYYLKARLRNYMLLEELLLTPENIRKHAEQQLGAMGAI